jgi:hypothetical protein
MVEGKLLGHIVAAQGVKIDLERVEEINIISLPRHKRKPFNPFLGRSIFFEGSYPTLLNH